MNVKKFELFFELMLKSSLLSLLLSCNIINQNKSNTMKIDWLPTESAYSVFPMMISEGYFTDENNAIVTLHKNKLAFNGWANVGSTIITDFKKKNIPVKLSFKWYSLIEDKSFGADIELNTNKIVSILAQHNTENEQFYFTVGMAPKGMLYLWIKCDGVTELVQTCQANQIEKEWKVLFPEISMEKESFIGKSLGQILTKEQIDSSKLILGSDSNIWKNRNLNNFGINYSVETDAPIDNATVLFFDGELNSFNLQGNKFDEKFANINSVPKSINFYWIENNKKLNLEMSFDEDELFKSIDKLKSSQSINLQLIMSILKTGAVQIIMKNDAEFYEFKKVKSKLIMY